MDTDTDTSKMIWMQNVEDPDSGDEDRGRIEERRHMNKLLSQGYAIGKPKASRVYTVEELVKRKIAGLYRPT